MQPARQRRVVLQRRRLAGEVREYLLGDLLRQMGSSIGPAQRRGVHEVKVPPDQFRKGGLVPGFGVTAEEFGIGGHPGSPTNRSPNRKRTNNVNFHSGST